MLKSLFNTYTCLPSLEKTMACLGSLNPAIVFLFVRVAMSITERVLSILLPLNNMVASGDKEAPYGSLPTAIVLIIFPAFLLPHQNMRLLQNFLP